MVRIAAFALVAAAAIPLPAAAQFSWYAGLSAGQSITDDALVRNREGTITLGSDFSTDFDDQDTAWKATLGLRINPMLSIEANYADLGSHSLHTAFLGGDPPLPAAIFIRRDVTAIGADLVLRAPFAQFEVFGRVGAAQARMKAHAELSGNVEFTGGAGERQRSTRRDETVGRYGLGLQWNLTPTLGLRAQWERYVDVGKAFRVGGTGTTGEADMDFVSAGVVLHY